MPKIKITRPCVIDGVAAAVGDIVEASEKDARYVCAIGKALPVANAISQEKIDELNERLTEAQATSKSRGRKAEGARGDNPLPENESTGNQL